MTHRCSSQRCPFRMWSVLGAALVLWGCSSETGAIPTFPVQGQVRFQGQAAPGAFVVFHPLDPSAQQDVRPTGQAGPDGTFRLTTFDDHDGAPEGDYAVTIEWYKLVGKGADIQRGPNVVPAKYGKPETTPLRFSVRQGKNDLGPLQITR